MKYDAWCAFAAHDEMETIRDYIEDGRVYADASEAELKAWWQEAQRDFLVQPSEQARDDYFALNAELRLRNLNRPAPVLTNTDRQIVQRNLRLALGDPLVQQRLRADVEAFHRLWQSPPH
jgi:hypothetical protein